MLNNKTISLPLRAMLWLLILGPGFFILYGNVNHFTATLEPVANIHFSFEQYIPVIQWHFIPYLILDIMFGASLFLCKSSQEMDRHAKRLAAAIVFSVICFLLWPLKFSFDRPEMTGWIGKIYNAFIEFDLPYNQAPSLHVSLTVLVGIIFVRHLPKLLFWPIILWCGLIILSVVTTHQHHIIDIITAIPVVFFCFALFPDEPEHYRTPGYHTHSHWVGYLYLGLGLSCLLAGGYIRYSLESSTMSYWSALLLWPAMACLIMTKAYLTKDVSLLQKSAAGSINRYVYFLLLPITVTQAIYKKSYHKKVDTINEVLPGIFIARRLSNKELTTATTTHNIKTLIDVAPEFNAPQIENINYQALHWLDLAPVDTQALQDASHTLTQALTKGCVVIECKLGLQRSALVVLAYLIIEKSMTPNEAYRLVKEKRNGAVLREKQLNELHTL